MEKTSLSAGNVIYKILAGNEAVTGKATKVFPVAADNAILPYVAYRRSRMEQTAEKGRANPYPASPDSPYQSRGRVGADTVYVEVNCYGATYAESVELAEAVRGALDGARYESDGLVMRCCMLSESQEYYEDDAYVQELVFKVRI